MGVNVLGARKTRALSRALAQPVVWAWVWSHHDSGRWARVTTADHRHGWYDRVADDWDPDAAHGQPVYGVQGCTSSCRLLFVEPLRRFVEARAAALRAGVPLLGVPWASEPLSPVGPDQFAELDDWPPPGRPAHWFGRWPPVCPVCGHRHAGMPCAGHRWRDTCGFDAGRECPGQGGVS